MNHLSISAQGMIKGLGFWMGGLWLSKAACNFCQACSKNTLICIWRTVHNVRVDNQIVTLDDTCTRFFKISKTRRIHRNAIYTACYTQVSELA